MKGKWKRFGVFVLAATALIGAVVVTAREGSQGTLGLVARVWLVGVMAYLITFVVWPRRTEVVVEAKSPGSVPGPKSNNSSKSRAQRPQGDLRPVVVIQPRPAGSRPGSRLHMAENPTPRNSRGRPINDRQSNRDFRWPAQR